MTREVSTGPTGGNDAFDASYDGVSADGSRVFFSTSESLVAADTDRPRTRLRADLSNGTTTLVSQGAASCARSVAATASRIALRRCHRGRERGLLRHRRTARTGRRHRWRGRRLHARPLLSGTTSLVKAPGDGQPACGNGAFTATLRGVVSADGTRAFFATFRAVSPAPTRIRPIPTRDLPGGPNARNWSSRAIPPVPPAAATITRMRALPPAPATDPGSFKQARASCRRTPTKATKQMTPTSGRPGDVTLRLRREPEPAGELLRRVRRRIQGSSSPPSRHPPLTKTPPRTYTSGRARRAGIPSPGQRMLRLGPSGRRRRTGPRSFTTNEQLSPAGHGFERGRLRAGSRRGGAETRSRWRCLCAPACGNGEAAGIFNGISSDGSKVFFFTTDEQLSPKTPTPMPTSTSTTSTARRRNWSYPCRALRPLSEGCDALFDRPPGGDHVFFQTTERMTEGDVDSESDIYERSRADAAGLDRQPRHARPGDPRPDRTSPVSPNASTTPLVIGQAAPKTAIKATSPSTAPGTWLAAGTGAELGGAGLPVIRVAGSTTGFRATASRRD